MVEQQFILGPKMKFDIGFGNKDINKDILSFSSRYKNLQIVKEGEFECEISGTGEEFSGTKTMVETDYNEPLAFLVFHVHDSWGFLVGDETIIESDNTIWKIGTRGYWNNVYMDNGNLYFKYIMSELDVFRKYRFYYFIFNQRLNENVEYDVPDVKSLPEDSESTNIMRIAKSGKDVGGDDIVYDSNDKNLLLYRCDYSDMPSSYINYSWRGDKYIYHNLGYSPMTLGYFQWATGTKEYYIAPQYPSFLYKIYDDRIHWQLEGIGDIYKVSTLIFSDPTEL